MLIRVLRSFSETRNLSWAWIEFFLWGGWHCLSCIMLEFPYVSRYGSQIRGTTVMHLLSGVFLQRSFLGLTHNYFSYWKTPDDTRGAAALVVAFGMPFSCRHQVRPILTAAKRRKWQSAEMRQVGPLIPSENQRVCGNHLQLYKTWCVI